MCCLLFQRSTVTVGGHWSTRKRASHIVHHPLRTNICADVAYHIGISQLCLVVAAILNVALPPSSRQPIYPVSDVFLKKGVSYTKYIFLKFIARQVSLI